MADLIRIDTDQVVQIANNLSQLNDDLQTKLEEVRSAIKNLDTVWTGEAATATKDAIDEFATEYFQSYHDLIDEYVQFLKTNVAEGYTQTEDTNITLAEAFK